MKRAFVFAVLFLLGATASTRSQTPLPPLAPPAAPPRAAMSQQEIEQNYKSLKGEVDDLKEWKADFQKRHEEIQRQLGNLRDQAAKLNPDSATKEDVKRLTEAIQEVDRKREEDAKRILAEFEKLGKVITAPQAGGRGGKPPPEPPPTAATMRGDESGVWYTIKQNDTFPKIAAAYREQGIKVTGDQIAKANPTADPNRLGVGKKLFIPVPKPAGVR